MGRALTGGYMRPQRNATHRLELLQDRLADLVSAVLHRLRGAVGDLWVEHALDRDTVRGDAQKNMNRGTGRNLNTKNEKLRKREKNSDNAPGYPQT